MFEKLTAKPMKREKTKIGFIVIGTQVFTKRLKYALYLYGFC